MSIIIKHNGQLKMYMKGADSIVKKRLNSKHKSPILDNIDGKLT